VCERESEREIVFVKERVRERMRERLFVCERE
jgi:hypothetical protein